MSNMNEDVNTAETVNEVTLPPGTKEMSINIDDLKPNTILAIYLDVESPEEKMMAAPTFAKLFNPYAKQLREKKISVMLLTTNEKIDLVSEDEMNQMGWFKKEKSLIINPYAK